MPARPPRPLHTAAVAPRSPHAAPHSAGARRLGGAFLHQLLRLLRVGALAPLGATCALPVAADGLRWPAPGVAWRTAAAADSPAFSSASTSHLEAQPRWSAWQGRIGLALADDGPAAGPGLGPGLRLQGMRLLGDYYFSPASGFHATGGVISGPLARPWGAASSAVGGGLTLSLHSPRWADGWVGEPSGPAARAYVGAGYSLGDADGRWSISADIGLVARSPAGSRWGPDAAGWTSLGEGLDRWQVQPLLQLGVSVAF